MRKQTRRDSRRGARSRRRADNDQESTACRVDSIQSDLSDRPDIPSPIELNPLERLGGLILFPARTLSYALHEQDWGVPVTLASVVAVVMTSRAVGSGALHGASDVAEFLGNMPSVFLFSTLLQIGLPWLAQSIILGSLARLLGRQPRFAASLAVVGYARLPMLYAAMVTVLLSSLGERAEPAARVIALGLGAVVPPGSQFSGALSALNLPNLWGLGLMTLAIEHLCAVPRGRAALIAGGYATVSIIATLLMSRAR